ncbi:MAG: hypothetical protein WA823_17940 [Candidatus Acidiferrales bacterium]
MHAGKLILTAAVVAAFPLTSCSHHHVQEVDPGTLLSVAKTYRQGPHATTVATPDVENNEKDFKIDVEEMLLDKDFDGLERVAQEARVKQTRLTGGPWKLYKFYEAISTPVAGEKATDDDWKTQLYALKQWENAKATSATAHIATATAYEEYGAFARGTGYANSVGDDAWESLSERYAIAEHELLAAATMQPEDPYWFYAVQVSSFNGSWNAGQSRGLFEQAVAFEPAFYHYYREYAYYLLPKWFGEPGDAEALARDSMNRPGGDQGAFVYFEIASQLTCQFDSRDTDMKNLSWPTIKAGYAALGRMYGVSPLKANRFARMAIEMDDKEAAQSAFAIVGDDWELMSWKSKSNFDRAKNWAEGQ